jgi:hypothetical protein
MTYDDYISQVTADAIEVIDCGDADHCGDLGSVFDYLFACDSVTGNGSGSYTFSTWQAQQNVAEIIWDDDFARDVEEFGYTLADLVEMGPERVDVLARCMALEHAWHAIEEAWEARVESLEAAI